MASTDVATIITDAQTNAKASIAEGKAILDELETLSNENWELTGIDELSFETYDKSTTILSEMTTSAPSIGEITKYSGNLDATVSLESVNYTETSVPELSASSPSLDYGTKPDSTMPTAPTMSDMNEVTMPTKPSVSYPADPTFSDTEIPTLDSYEDPTLSSPINLSGLSAPTTEFSWVETAYSAVIQDDIVTALQNDISGGLLPDETTEISKFKSAADKILNQNTEDISRTYSANGFYFPTGVLTKVLDEANQANVEAKLASLETLKNDYMKIRVSTRQAAITAGINLENMLRDFCSALNERSLNYEKAVIEKAIALFDSQIEEKRLYIENYNAGVNGYNAAWQGVTTKLTAFKTKVDAAGLSVEIKKQLLEIYTAKVNTIKTKYDIYKTQMEAARLNFDMESAKLSRYKTMIDAYAEKIRAKVAEFELYKATIQGEQTKVETYKVQVDAFKSQVEAAKTQADIRKTSADVVIEKNRDTISKINAEIEVYKALANTHIEYEREVIQKYSTQVEAWKTKGLLTAEAWKLWLGIANINAVSKVEKVKMQAESDRINLDQIDKNAKLNLAAITERVGLHKQIIMGYMSAINTLAVQEKSSSA